MVSRLVLPSAMRRLRRRECAGSSAAGRRRSGATAGWPAVAGIKPVAPPAEVLAGKRIKVTDSDSQAMKSG